MNNELKTFENLKGLEKSLEDLWIVSNCRNPISLQLFKVTYENIRDEYNLDVRDMNQYWVNYQNEHLGEQPVPYLLRRQGE